MEQHSLFRSFDKQGIHNFDELEHFLWNTDIYVINSFVTEIQDIIEDEKTKIDYSPFAFYPNPNLSGIGGCYETQCKLRRAKKFSLFASLYADVIFLPFEPVNINDDISRYTEEKTLQYLYDVKNLLSLLLEYRDLINFGIVKLSINRSGICKSCFDKVLQEHRKIFNIANLIKLYIDQSTISVERDEHEKGKYWISYADVANIVPDNHIVAEYYSQNIPELEYYSLKKVINDPKLKEKLLSDLIISSIGEGYETACFAQSHLAKMITDVPLDLQVAQLLQEDNQDIIVAKKSCQRVIDYDLPIIGNTSIEKILQLRERLQDSFNLYRNSINTFIYKNQTNNSINLQELYDKEIYPQFTELTARINEMKTKQLRRIIGEGVIWLSTLGIGYTSGLISSVSQAIAAAGGLATIIHGTTDRIFKFQQEKEEVKRNPYFFLWKLNNEKNNKNFVNNRYLQKK